MGSDITMALRVMLFLLFMNLSGYSSAAIHQARRWRLAEMPCKVNSPFNPDLASAFLEAEVVPTLGCMTNATSRKAGAEIHVIRYQGNKEQNVELLLNDFEKKGFDEPLVIILSSNVTVYWQIRLRQNPKNLGKHTFVVAKGSGLRFAYKHLSSRPTISKPKHLPFETDDLLIWVTKRYSVITTFTSVPGGNHLTITVGKAQQSSSSSSTCSLSSDIDDSNVKAISMVTQPVEGCLMQDRYPGPIYKVAYVIELKEVPDVDKFEVHLDLRGHSIQHGEQETKLVLKAPSQVTWRVYTKKIKGLIHIVANSYVDMSGIRVETVSVRSEELRETGLDLLRWVQYYLEVPISMYTSMNNSNRIQITLPEIEEKDDRTVKQMKNSLRISLRTECNTKAVTVSIDKTVLQMLGIKKSMLTLLDPKCTASENATHVYIQSSPEACGTSSIATQIGRQALSNALVVHDTNIVTEDVKDTDSLEGGSGNDDIFSGSGDNEITDLVLDDEDLELQRIQVNFMCVLLQEPKPEMEVTPDLLPETDLQLQLFDNFLFLAPYVRYPVKLEQSDKRLYLQAIAMSDPLLRANMEHCWLSPELDSSESSKYSLVEHSCGEDSTVAYIPSGTPQSERLSFTPENYVKLATNPTVVLKCAVSICCINKKCGSYNLPVCPDRSVDCGKQRHSHDNSERTTQMIIVGTLSLPEQVTSYEEGTDSPGLNIETDVPETGEVSETNKEPMVIEGLDSGTVVGIAFAAFIIGAMMMGALWFIHTHSGKLFASGPFKRSMGVRETPEQEDGYVETTPGSSVPIST